MCWVLQDSQAQEMAQSMLGEQLGREMQKKLDGQSATSTMEGKRPVFAQKDS